jgi:hypothetical protein
MLKKLFRNGSIDPILHCCGDSGGRLSPKYVGGFSNYLFIALENETVVDIIFVG